MDIRWLTAEASSLKMSCKLVVIDGGRKGVNCTQTNRVCPTVDGVGTLHLEYGWGAATHKMAMGYCLLRSRARITSSSRPQLLIIYNIGPIGSSSQLTFHFSMHKFLFLLHIMFIFLLSRGKNLSLQNIRPIRRYRPTYATLSSIVSFNSIFIIFIFWRNS